jgi:hypothetical protein
MALIAGRVRTASPIQLTPRIKILFGSFDTKTPVSEYSLKGLYLKKQSVLARNHSVTSRNKLSELSFRRKEKFCFYSN